MNCRCKKINLAFVFAMMLFATVFGPASFAQNSDEPIKATASFNADKEIASDTAIEIKLSRTPAANEKVAITIGQTDVTALFDRSDLRLVYNSKILPLATGKSTVTVYLIQTNGAWKEVARFAMTVAAKSDAIPTAVESPKVEEKTAETAPAKTEKPFIDTTPKEIKPDEAKPTSDQVGAETKTATSEKPATEAQTPETPTAETPATPATETPAAETPTVEKKRFFKFLPSFAISMESQPLQQNFPVDARPEKRATFTDFNLTGSIKTEAKIGNITNESNFDFAGSSFKEKTLQFGALGREAPDVDLSSYLMNFTIAKAKVSVGHTSFGGSRHLVNSFSSRGLSASVPINKYFDVTGGMMNGTSVLGVKNFLGVSQIRHQMQGATLGIEFFPKRKNAMRLEVTGFNGYLQALNGVSEGQIVDAERSRGFGFRFITSDKTGRFKVEAGYALSRFFNANDPSLDPNNNAVPVQAVIRSAFYIDSTNQILKDIKLTKKKNLNLSVGFKYEYVEPLYRSLGASASADKATQDYSIDGSIGEITFQAGHGRSNDNLRSVPSILKLLTRSTRFSVALPLSAIVGDSEKPSPLLPRLGYSIDRTNNLGDAIPVNGGFEVDLGSVPDLVSTNQTASSSWQFKKFNVGYTYGRTFADNRQAGSENKDQLGWVHGLSFGLNPSDIIGFTVGLSFDSQQNFELDQINRTKTLNLGTTWKPFKGATFTGELAQTLAGDAAQTSLARNVNYSGQFAYSFAREKTGFEKFGFQLFARFADAFTRNRNTIEITNIQTRTKIMTAGMTVNFF